MNRLNLWMFMRSLLLLTFLLALCIPAYPQRGGAFGTVWFYRDTDPSVLDPTIFKIVPSFSERLAVLKPASYFAFDAPVGVHSFSWTAAPAKGETVTITVAAGDQVFVKVQFRGMVRAEEPEAARRMQRMEPITSPLSFDKRVSHRVFLPEPSLNPKKDALAADVAVPDEPQALPGPLAAHSAINTEPEVSPARPKTPGNSSVPGAGATDTAVSLVNDDVVMLVEAGLSRELIAAKIRSSKTNFDTSPSELIALKKAGVHESIILVMISADAPPVAATRPAATAPPEAPSPAVGTAVGGPGAVAPVFPVVPATGSAPAPVVGSMADEAIDEATGALFIALTEKAPAVTTSTDPGAVILPSVDKPGAEPNLVAAFDKRPMRRLPEPPRILSQPAVVYPEDARKNGVQGLVEIDVAMRPDGSVIGLHLVSSPHPLLSETALHSVSQWQFDPPPTDRANSEVIFRVVVKFTIE